MGHAINKILKDAILRCHILKGNKVHYVPGWDCHGLPIELKATTSSINCNPIEVRSKAKTFAEKTIEVQKKTFQSWGVLGDWKNSYKTYTVDYVKTQLRQFYKLYKKELVYRDVKPVHWSPSSRTALAEAELEYNDNHKSPSAYIRFELKQVPKLDFLKDKKVYTIIWTTTPWTLPSNHAVCYNELLSYSILKRSDPQDTNIYIVATDLVKSVSSILNTNFEIVKVVKGDQLEGAEYEHPIYKDRVHKLFHSPHATTSKGTGLVHNAGAHGPDDFVVALTNKIPIVDLVNEFGTYESDAGPILAGKEVLSEGNKTVLDMLKNDLMYLGEITHSYPYDWRTKKPVIIRASKQWFIDTESIKNAAVELLDSVKFIPSERAETYKKNLTNQILKRPYWCISRQRKWGVPIPVFYNKNTSETIIDENTMAHQLNLLEKYGTDFWWQFSTSELLPESSCTSPEILEKGEDIMDIWLDSGLSWAKVLEGEKVADMYLEGVDQLTGWFQSSLLTSVALRNKAPYRSLYVHGFAVDQNGTKMSKSIGNVVNPVHIKDGKKGQKPYGVDTLRWWVTCHANQVSLAHVSTNVLDSSAEEVQKIRSILRFALGSLSDYENSEEYKNNLLLIDKYMLHLLLHFHNQVGEFLENYQFHKVSATLLHLLTNPVSALYYTSVKDRLYCDNLDNSRRRAAQHTLLQILEVVTRSIAPMVPHLAEEIHLNMPQKDSKTYFTSHHAQPESDWENESIAKAMEVILNCKKDINKELGANTMAVNVTVIFSKQRFSDMKNLMEISELEQQLVDIFQVSNVSITEDNMEMDYELEISKSQNVSCPRCRKINSEKDNELCNRCYNVLNSSNNNKTVAVN
nr:isoleucine--tRNA ligase, mitochondrial-like [Leptinotarsa decemlineata]